MRGTGAVGSASLQPVVKHAAHYGGGGSCAKACVFNDCGNGNGGVIGGGKGDVERVVAFAFGQCGCVVFLVLAYAYGLRCACFAAALVGSASKYAARCAFFGYAYHGIFNEGDVLGLVAQVLHLAVGHGREGAGGGVLQGADYARRYLLAAIHHGCQGVRKLQHGKCVVALPNTQ